MTAHILIVDDQAHSRKLLALRLAHEGYAVQQAGSGEEALQALEAVPLQRWPGSAGEHAVAPPASAVASAGDAASGAAPAPRAPDLVLLDVLMPGIDGFETCRRLRALPQMRGVPVVMLTALGSTDDCVRGLEAGADDFIHKPFQPAELQARVRSLLRQKSLFDESQRQRAALADWSATLERRVAEAVAKVERLSRLQRFFSPRLAARLVGAGDDSGASGESALRSHRAEVTVLFADLRGFSAYAEHAPVERVVAMLADFHAAMGALIFAADGTLERFTGDGLMVFFNDPDPVPDHSALAVRLALAMQARAAELSADWKRDGGPGGLGIGISRGIAALGAVGFESRLDYAAIGPVTNLAARLCAEAGTGEVWVCDGVQASIGARFALQPLPTLTLKGLAQPVRAWKVMASHEATP